MEWKFYPRVNVLQRSQTYENAYTNPWLFLLPHIPESVKCLQRTPIKVVSEKIEKEIKTDVSFDIREMIVVRQYDICHLKYQERAKINYVKLKLE